MNTVDPLKPIDSSSKEISERVRPASKEEQVAEKGSSLAAVNDTRPSLDSGTAEALADNLGEKLDKAPESAMGALGNFDEDRIRALLED